MDDVIKALEELKKINHLTNEIFTEEIGYIEEMCNNNTFKVVVIGEFSSGKSTFLNALIGKRILYSDMDEATGITTTIENNKSNKAIINFEDGDIKQIPIGTEANYKKLSNYLNINKQDGKKVKYVNVQYAFDGIDEDIIFVDTPGLQGMSEEQLLTTKEAIKDANATIMLINKKGISQTELDLICGRNKEFGKIKTKEIFILINKIGEIYDSNNIEVSNEKVEKIINQVKSDLFNEDINDTKVFAIDGLDYLHGKDDNLYEKFKKSKENTSYKVLSQDEYISRSRYENFKNELFKFLEVDNRKKAFEEDIKEKISIILEEIEGVVEENLDTEKYKSKNNLDKYNREISMLLENRRRFINILKRQVGELSDELLENINKEIDEYKESLVGNGGRILLSIEDEIKKESIDKLKSKVNKLLSDTENLIKSESKDIEKTIKVFYENLSDIISETFTQEFKKIFKNDLKVNFDFENQNVSLNLKFNEEKFINEYSKEIKKLKKDLDKKKDQYSTEEKGKVKQYIDRYEKDIKEIESNLDDLERDYKREKRNLGNRPEPTQKYRTVERTKRSWIFFKKTYYEEVPDGVDDSRGQQWDKKNKELDSNLRLKQNKLFNQKQNIIDKLNSYKRELIKIKTVESDLKRDEETILRLEKTAKKNIEKNKDNYIESKKQEIYIWMNKYVDDNVKNLYNTVELILNDKNESIKKSIQVQGEDYLKEYQNKLENKMEEIKESIRNRKCSDQHLFELINNVKDILEEG